MAITFDRLNKFIVVGAPTTEVSIQTLLNSIRDYEDELSNLDIHYIVDAYGKQPLGGDTYVGITMVLLDGWLVRFEDRLGPEIVSCKISGGNILAYDAAGVLRQDPVTSSDFVFVTYTSSSSATLTEQASIQYSSFNGGVTIDVVAGEAGTAFPHGTPQLPSNNLADTMTIAVSRGFPTIYVIGDLEIDNGGDYSGMQFVGSSTTKTHVVITSDSLVLNCEFFEATVEGTLDGNAQLRGCRILNLNYISGVVESCLLGPGVIVLGGGSEAHFIDCWSGIATNVSYPTIDCGGSGQTLAMRNYNGEVKIINKTGPENVTIDLGAGRVALDSTVTAGHVIVRGTGTLEDSSTGTTTVDSTTLLNSGLIAETVYGVVGEEIQQSSFADRVCIDVVNGVAGTAFPLGTETNPVNNLADAKTIADSRGIAALYLLSDLTVATGENIDDYTVQSDDWFVVTVESGASVVNTEFHKVSLYGVMSAYWNILVDCWVYDITNFSGWMRGGSFESIALSVAVPGAEFGGLSYFDEVVVMYPGVSAQLTMNDGVSVSCTSFAESCEIHSMTSGSILTASLNGGEISIDASCTGGDITILGTGKATNNSTLSIDTLSLLNSELIAETVYQTIGEEIQQSSFAGRVCLDAVSGSAGTVFPLGTAVSPVNNLADAVTIAGNRGIETIRIIGDYTFTGSTSIQNIVIEGLGSQQSVLTFETGCILAYCSIYKATCTGLGFGITRYQDCRLYDLGSSGLIPSSSRVIMRNCIIGGELTIPANYSGYLEVLDCWAENTISVPPVLSIGDSAINLIIRGYSGALKIQDCSNASASLSIELSGGIVLDSTVTAGSIGLRGVGSLVNNSIVVPDTTGYISNTSIAGATWDEVVADHLGVGTTGEALSDAGASGNPWSTPITGNTDPGTFGEMVAKKLLKLKTWLSG